MAHYLGDKTSAIEGREESRLHKVGGYLDLKSSVQSVKSLMVSFCRLMATRNAFCENSVRSVLSALTRTWLRVAPCDL